MPQVTGDSHINHTKVSRQRSKLDETKEDCAGMNGFSPTQNRKESTGFCTRMFWFSAIFIVVGHLQGEELLSHEDFVLFCYNIMLVKTPDRYTGQNGSLKRHVAASQHDRVESMPIKQTKIESTC